MGPFLVEHQPMRARLKVQARWIGLDHVRRQPGLRLVGLEQQPIAPRRPTVESTAPHHGFLEIDQRFGAEVMKSAINRSLELNVSTHIGRRRQLRGAAKCIACN